jgi:hypothetical protein
MQPTSVARPVGDRPPAVAEFPGKNEAYASGVSWAAIVGGAFVAAAMALILVALGAGFGFSMVSPWANAGAGAATVTGLAIFWLIITQILASAFGGYVAGRLRTRWVQVHTDEVYFRDTAHGLLVWAVGLVITASLLGTAATSLAGSTATRGNSRESTAANDYFVDSFLHTNNPPTNDASQRGEVASILAHSLLQKNLSPTDETYLSQIVSARTGLSKADADKRVEQIFSDAQQSADKTRKAIAHLSLWVFVALLSGAFSASYAATIGGRQRDRVTD